MNLQIRDYRSAEGQKLVANSKRPEIQKLPNGREMVINSRLDHREWELFDTAVVEAARSLLVGVADLRMMKLVNSGVDYGIQVVTQRVQSERRTADVGMDTRTRVNRDRTDRKPISIPVPVISTEYELGERELRASRNLGAPLDVTEARECGASIADTMEDMLFTYNGVMFAGLPVYGYLNAPGAHTASASSLGGGDFAIADNAYNTVKGVLGAQSARRFRGDWMIYLNSVQYHECLTLRDNTDTTQLGLIKNLPGIVDVKESDRVTAGSMVVVHMNPSTIEWIEALPVQNREWESGDMSTFNGKVLTVAVPWIKVDYRGYSGVSVISGC